MNFLLVNLDFELSSRAPSGHRRVLRLTKNEALNEMPISQTASFIVYRRSKEDLKKEDLNFLRSMLNSSSFY